MKIFLLVLIVAAATIGCSTKKVDELEAFRRKHPEKSSGYYKMMAASPEFLDVAADLHASVVTSLLHGVSNRIDNPDALREFIVRRMEWDWREDFALPPDLMEALVKNEAELFFFKYRKDGWTEDGFLVLKNGRIVAGGAEE